jgi:hypothetical protein
MKLREPRALGLCSPGGVVQLPRGRARRSASRENGRQVRQGATERGRTGVGCDRCSRWRRVNNGEGAGSLGEDAGQKVGC